MNKRFSDNKSLARKKQICVLAEYADDEHNAAVFGKRQADVLLI